MICIFDFLGVAATVPSPFELPMTNEEVNVFSPMVIRAPFQTGTWSIPPGQENHSIFIRCPAEGLSQILPPEPSQMVAFAHHMHQVGTRFKMYIARDGKEIHRFESYYDFTHQISSL